MTNGNTNQQQQILIHDIQTAEAAATTSGSAVGGFNPNKFASILKQEVAAQKNNVLSVNPNKTTFNPLVYIFGVPIVIILGGTRIGPLVNISLVAVLVGMITKTIVANTQSSTGATSTSTGPVGPLGPQGA